MDLRRARNLIQISFAAHNIIRLRSTLEFLTVGTTISRLGYFNNIASCLLIILIDDEIDYTSLFSGVASQL
jgi:hypothetical protein